MLTDDNMFEFDLVKNKGRSLGVVLEELVSH